MLDGWCSRSASCEKKKNVLSGRTGPPSTPPKSLKCCSGLARWFALTNQSLASSASSLKYSNSEPRNALVPERVTIEICPPGVRPNSGANEDRGVRYSFLAYRDNQPVF